MGKDTNNPYKAAADTCFEYLRNVIYEPAKAVLDTDKLPEDFCYFGKALKYFGDCIIEMTTLAKELSRGNLNCALPLPGNELAAPLKMLHASLKHLTWQAQQVAHGDYQQRVDFMGGFSEAFNNMIIQLGQRWQINLDEKSKLRRYMNLMLANCPDPILLFDRENQLVYVSESYLKCCDIQDAGVLLGKHLREQFAPFVSVEFLDKIEAMFKISAAEKRTTQTERAIDFAHDGSYRYFQIKITPMLDEDRETEGVMIFLHDTTEAERARREAEKARELAEHSSRAKSDFLARMSHEMRTPLNAIIGMASTYGSSADIQRKDYCVERINGASKHLLGVINDILDMSKIETDTFELSYNKVDFRKMIDFAVGIVAFKINERGQNLSVSIAPEIPETITADEQRLIQVITNLLSNAVKFTPESGDISLTAEAINGDNRSKRIRITVKDTGIGISEEQQRRLFVPFEQADGGVTRKYGGTGLGLAISKSIVEMMGGGIRVESEIGKGSSFIFELPVGEEPDVSQRQSVGSGTDENNAVIQDIEDGIFLGINILLAEDVEINREVISFLLEHTGIYVHFAVDGVEAVEKFAAAPNLYGLILMDINMPNLDGYGATKRIRESGLSNADSIPIIAITANAFREDIEKCFACGMNGHIAKPIDTKELISKLKEYLSE